ncbi:MAG TPA: DMT family transporter [Friedmanniella sp.]
MTTTSGSSVLAVVLAAVGAVFFGLASVRQHGAVRATAAPARSSLGAQVVAGLRLLKHPTWIIGAVQALLGGGLHVVALALAPITLVQPVGVLAVPVTVVASALARRRRPAPTQVLGTLLSVAGVAALTVVLLLPAAQPATLPAWRTLATGVGAVLVGGGVVVLLLVRASMLLRCVSRAVVAAAFFGLNSILIRTLGEVFAARPDHATGLVVTSLVGLGLALPLGIWAMQSAYLFGSPQVVICCLTLIDPLTAVVGGRLLLQDGATITGTTAAVAVVCALVAAVGVVLLARDYPVEPGPELAGVTTDARSA